MKITFGETYILEKLECGWQLWKWYPSKEIPKGKYAGRMSKEAYRPMGKYPHNIRHAIEIMANDYAAGCDETLSFKEFSKQVTQYIHGLDAIAEEVECKIQSP